MNAKSHLILGVVVTSAFIFALIKSAGMSFKIWEFLIFIGIVFIYSQLPDIDIQASKIRWIITVAFLISIILLLSLGKPALAFILLFIITFVWVMRLFGIGHRGLVHTSTAGFLLSLPLLVFGVIPFVVGVLNYSAHLLVDGRGRGHR